jgi:hypothetical protein
MARALLRSALSLVQDIVPASAAHIAAIEAYTTAECGDFTTAATLAAIAARALVDVPKYGDVSGATCYGIFDEPSERLWAAHWAIYGVYCAMRSYASYLSDSSVSEHTLSNLTDAAKSLWGRGGKYGTPGSEADAAYAAAVAYIQNAAWPKTMAA